MSDLEQLRDHARRLSAAGHRDDCERIHRIVKVDRRLMRYDLDHTLSCASIDGHEPHRWVTENGFDWWCPGLCAGCMPVSERALWLQIADEIDAYLTPEDEGYDGYDLFGEEE